MRHIRVPFGLGRATFSSLDLRRELPAANFPQFCRPISPSGEAFLVLHDGAAVATTVDIECATVVRDSTGAERLTVRLNDYATKLLSDVVREPGRTNVMVCHTTASDPGETSVDASGRPLFSYGLSKAAEQKACLAKVIDLKPSCGSQ